MLEEIQDFFKDVDDIDLIDFSTNFIIGEKPVHERTSTLIKKFLDLHGLNSIYADHIYNIKNRPIFLRGGISGKSVLDKINSAITFIICQRFTTMAYEGKIADNENRIMFNDLKVKLLDIYWHLNQNEQYMHSKEGDEKELNEITSMEWKSVKKNSS